MPPLAPACLAQSLRYSMDWARSTGGEEGLVHAEIMAIAADQIERHEQIARMQCQQNEQTHRHLQTATAERDRYRADCQRLGHQLRRAATVLQSTHPQLGRHMLADARAALEQTEGHADSRVKTERPRLASQGQQSLVPPPGKSGRLHREIRRVMPTQSIAGHLWQLWA